jgi:phosphoglycolate phosphatase
MTPPAAPPSRKIHQKPKAILFDWDNTLVDSWPVIHDALNVTLAAYGLEPWTLAETRQRVRKSMRDSFPALFGERWEEAGEVFYERYAAIHIEKIVAAPYAPEMLRHLHAQGIYLGVVSNKKGDFLRREAAHLGWDRYFGRLVGALDAERDKPAREPILLALEGSGIAPGRMVWFAGDADIDMECAANSGCIPVLIREEAPKNEEFPNFPPEWHFGACLALCKHLRNM